jgi:hypothetical protein
VRELAKKTPEQREQMWQMMLVNMTMEECKQMTQAMATMPNERREKMKELMLVGITPELLVKNMQHTTVMVVAMVAQSLPGIFLKSPFRRGRGCGVANNCPGEHGLKAFEVSTTGMSMTCDRCDKAVEGEAVMKGCRKCNFDLCATCTEGCGPDCALSHWDRETCLVCGCGWGAHFGHKCANGTRGSWMVDGGLAGPAMTSAVPSVVAAHTVEETTEGAEGEEKTSSSAPSTFFVSSASHTAPTQLKNDRETGCGDCGCYHVGDEEEDDDDDEEEDEEEEEEEEEEDESGNISVEENVWPDMRGMAPIDEWTANQAFNRLHPESLRRSTATLTVQRVAFAWGQRRAAAATSVQALARSFASRDMRRKCAVLPLVRTVYDIVFVVCMCHCYNLVTSLYVQHHSISHI